MIREHNLPACIARRRGEREQETKEGADLATRTDTTE